MNSQGLNGDLNFQQPSYFHNQQQSSATDSSIQKSSKMPRGIIQQQSLNAQQSQKPQLKQSNLLYSTASSNVAGNNRSVAGRELPSQSGRQDLSPVPKLVNQSMTVSNSQRQQNQSAIKFNENDVINSGRSQSNPRVTSEGVIMLDAIRKKKETEMQLRMIENRIRRLKDEEHQAVIKQKLQMRQIEHILRVRMQAQQEKEAQQRRKEEELRAQEERKAKVQKDKQMIVQSREHSVRKHANEISKLVGELKNESNARNVQLYQMKDRQISENRHIAKIKVQNSPFKQLEERRRKLLNENRQQYLMRLAMNYQETEINQKKVQELARLEQQLMERLQEHTKKQMKVQEEYQSLLGVSQAFGSQQQPLNSQRPGTTAGMISKPMVTTNNSMRGVSQGRMRSTSNGFPKSNRVPATLNNYFSSSNNPAITSKGNNKLSLINSSQQNDSQPRIIIKDNNFSANAKVPQRQVHTSSIQSRPKITTMIKVQAKPNAVLNQQNEKAKVAVQKEEAYDDDYEDDFATVETSKVQGRKSPPIVVNNISQSKKQSPVQSKSSSGSMRYSQGGSPQNVSNNIQRILKQSEDTKHVQNDDYEDDYEQLQESQIANIHKKQPSPTQLNKIKEAKRNINPKALLSGNSDQNAESDEYQEINDRELEDFEQKYSGQNVKKPNQSKKQKSVKPQKLTSTQKATAQTKQTHQKGNNDLPKTDLQRMIEEGQLRNFDYDDDEEEDEEEDRDYNQNRAALGHSRANDDDDDEYNEYSAAVESQRRAMQQNANGGRESPKFGQQSDGDEYEDDYEN